LPRLDAELIIAHVLKKPREFVLANPETKIKRLKDLKIKKLFKQCQQNKPLAYITGHKEFFGLDFKVNKNVLIPRPDTELMVELVFEKIKRLKDYKIILVDVGTGTGCIPITILKTNPTLPSPHRGGNSSPYKGEVGGGFATYAIDISAKALTVAKANAKKHGVKIKFIKGDLLSPTPPLLKGGRGDIGQQKFQIIITANLPYLTPSQFKSEPSIKHEPKLALVAGKDGLKYYRQLMKQIKKLSSEFKVRSSIFLEIDPSQAKSIKLLIKHHFPHAKITIHQDLSGKDRVVEVEI